MRKQQKAKPSTVSKTRKVLRLLIAQQHQRRKQNVSLRNYKQEIERSEKAGRLEWEIARLRKEIESIENTYSTQVSDWQKNGRCTDCGEWLTNPGKDGTYCDECNLLHQYEKFLLENP